jgi:hypothetical protein
LKKIRVSSAIIAVILAATACLAADLVAGGASKWKVYSLASSGQTLSSKVASSKTGGVSFVFGTTPSTNYVMTAPDSPDFTGKQISVAYTISAGATFSYDSSNGNTCGTPATARVYLQAASNGPFNPSNYWWSHSGSAVLVSGNSSFTADTNNPSDWSDYYGHSAGDSAYSDAFAAAVKNVGSVGLSFGGGCFFANGVGATPSGTSMSLTSFNVQ